MKLLRYEQHHHLGYRFTFMLRNDMALPPFCIYRQMAEDDGGWW